MASSESYTVPALKVWEAGIPRDTLLARVTPAMIDAVKLKRAEKVQKSSVDRNLQVLRRLFNWAIEQGLASDNPVRRVRFFRADVKRLRYLTEDEDKLLLAEAAKVTRSPFLRDAIEIAVHTGLRRGNLLRLQWSWVDWENRVIRVPRTKNGKPHAVPLSATAHATLKRLWGAKQDEVYARRGRTARPPDPADDDALRAPLAWLPHQRDPAAGRSLRKAKGQEKGKARARRAATPRKRAQMLRKVARPAGLEPATSWFVARRSIQLS